MLLDKYFDKLKSQDLNIGVYIPNNMKISNEDENGWCKYKLVKSNIDKNKISYIENKYGIKLPKDYIEFISKYDFLDVEIDKYRLIGVNTNYTLDNLFDLFPIKIIKDGYIPLGVIDDLNYIALNVNTGEVVELSYIDYKIIKKISDSLEKFLSTLESKID